MPPLDYRAWMWMDACELIERAERLQRQCFVLARRAPRPVWQAPVDVFEAADELKIVVALPGVDPERVEVAINGRVLVVAGVRALPGCVSAAAIHRLEIPYGLFERHILLPHGLLRVVRRDMVNGCLVLGLRKPEKG